MDNKEVRSLDFNKETLSDGNTIIGRAVVFNSKSNDLGFYETILPEAISDETVMKSDILCLINHDKNKILARNNKGKGKLGIEIREDGLYYSFDIPNTTLGRDFREDLMNDIYNGSSFAFTVEEDDWSVDPEGNYHRVIRKIKELFDVSPVVSPAYNEATVALRSLDDYKKLQEELKEVKEEIDSLEDIKEDIEEKMIEIESEITVEDEMNEELSKEDETKETEVEDDIKESEEEEKEELEEEERASLTEYYKELRKKYE